MFLGTRLEAAIGELYTANTGVPVYRDELHYTLQDKPIGTHVDFRTPDGGLVEAKTSRNKKGWGEALFSDDVPRHYWTQVQHQMAVLQDVSHADIAVLFGHDEFRIYRVPRNQAFIDSQLEDMNDWWNNYDVPRVPPPVDGSEAAGRWLRDAYPRETTQELIPATPEVQRIVEDLMVVRATSAALQRSDELLVQQLKDIIKDKPGMYGSKFLITWKENKGRKVIDWEGMARAVAPSGTVEELLPQFTTIKQGIRPFKVEEITVD
jgi:predicted phage-related endonuclease